MDQRIKDQDGYILVFSPEHPESDARGYVHEHRLVMGSYLGSQINEGEIVHHRDRQRHNNDIRNLLLMPSQDLHRALHRAINAQETALVSAWESWCLERMEDRRCHPSPPSDTSLVHEPVSLRGSAPRTLLVATPPPTTLAAAVSVVEVLTRIPNKKRRGEQLDLLVEQYEPESLLRAIAARIDPSQPRLASRLVWSVGALDVETAGPVLQALLGHAHAPELRRIIWSQLRKRLYRSLDHAALLRAAVHERGQALFYASTAIAIQCGALAKDALDVIETIEDPGYSRDRLTEALTAARRLIR